MMGQTEGDYELGYIPIYPIFHYSMGWINLRRLFKAKLG